MAQVALGFRSFAKTDFAEEISTTLTSHDIPFEIVDGVIFLISKRAYDSRLHLRSRTYDHPYSEFCMRLSDSTEGGSIGMGEGGLPEGIATVIHQVFGDDVLFELTLSCNSDWENLSVIVKFDEESGSHVFSGRKL